MAGHGDREMVTLGVLLGRREEGTGRSQRLVEEHDERESEKEREEEKGANHSREDSRQGSSSTFGFGFASIERVGELEERLSNRVGKGDGGRVDESDLANSPSLVRRLRHNRRWSARLPRRQIECEREAGRSDGTHHQNPRNIATQRSCSKEKTLGGGYLLKIERGKDPPSHQFEIKVDGLVGESDEGRRRVDSKEFESASRYLQDPTRGVPHPSFPP